MKYFTIALLLWSGTYLYGQHKDPFTYSARIVDNATPSVSNQDFTVEIVIQESPIPTKQQKYNETHLVKTDEDGWFSVKIGSGAKTTPETLNDIDWGKGQKYMYAKVTDSTGRVVSEAVNELLSTPHLPMAKNISNRALLTLACLTNLDELRDFPVPDHGEMICIKGHTSVRDGGEGFFYFLEDQEGNDDDGVVIKPKAITGSKPGRWVRELDGYINVNYFGITAGRSPRGTSNSEKIQKVIDFAAKNKMNDYRSKKGEILKGNTLFFPNGEYIIDGSLMLRNGVAIVGEENTFFTAKKDSDFDYFFTMDSGRVTISIDNIWLNGNGVGEVGGMFFKAKDGANGTGGLWQSRFRNINIVNIQGHGIHLEGGDSMGVFGENDYSLPNQWNVFENVRITRMNDEKNSLRMTLQQGQHTFINCLFLGKRDRSSLGTNIYIGNWGGSVVTFLNCTIQESVYGFQIENSSSITLDNCWFENVYLSIDVKGGKSINILNSRFANSAGYGSEGHTGPKNIPEEVPQPAIVSSENSSINIERNYVLASNPNSAEAQKSKFIVGRNNPETGLNTNNITARANTFAHPALSTTIGTVPNVSVALRTIVLHGRKNVLAVFDGTTVLRHIESSASGGEQLTLTINKEDGRGVVKIKDWKGKRRNGNINLNGSDEIELTHGQTVTFIKVDASSADNGSDEYYRLVSISN